MQPSLEEKHSNKAQETVKTKRGVKVNSDLLLSLDSIILFINTMIFIYSLQQGAHM